MYSYQPPTRPDLETAAANYRAEQGKNRGGCLTVWLGVSLALSLLTVLLLIQSLDAFRPGALPGGRTMPVSIVTVLLVLALGIANVVSIYGIFQWKRWGVYGLVAVLIASPVVELMIGTATGRDLLQPFIQIGLFAFLLRGKWPYFE